MGALKVLSPAGLDLASLSLNVEGDLIDLEHSIETQIYTFLGADPDSQKIDLH